MTLWIYFSKSFLSWKLVKKCSDQIILTQGKWQKMILQPSVLLSMGGWGPGPPPSNNTAMGWWWEARRELRQSLPISLASAWPQIKRHYDCCCHRWAKFLLNGWRGQGCGYRVPHLDLIQSEDLAWPDVLTNLSKTDAQWLPELWKFMPDPSFETFLTSHNLNGLRQERC